MIEFIVRTGARASEVGNLRIDDIGKHQIRLCGKSGAHWVPNHTALNRVVERLKADAILHGRQSLVGLDSMLVSQLIRRWAKRLEVRATGRILRHTLAFGMLDTPGVTLAEIQAQLGHARATTTNEYLQPGQGPNMALDRMRECPHGGYEPGASVPATILLGSGLWPSHVFKTKHDNMSKKLYFAGGLACIATLGFALSAPFNVVLETKECNGGTETQKLDSNSIPQGGTTLEGKIVNKLGRPINDMTVTVTGDKAATGPPVKTPPTAGGDTKASKPNSNSEDQAANSATDDGFTATVKFSNSGDLAHGNSINVEIPIADPGTASDITIKYAPSVNDNSSSTGAHADALEATELTAGKPGVVLGLDDGGHDRVSAFITNGEKSTGADLIAISGSCSLPTGVSVSSVYLLDPSLNFAEPTGTQISVSGNTFSVTGFSPLNPSETYELIVRFSAQPSAPIKVTLDGTFK